MTRLRAFLAALVIVAVAIGVVRCWQRRPKESWVGRPVRPALDWQKRISGWSRSPSAAMATVDRIAVHAIDSHIVEIDPQAQGSIPLGSRSTKDMGATRAHYRVAARRFRDQSKQALFPTASTSIPHHVIVASTRLQGDDAQQLLRLWQSQTLDCEPREGFSLCHSPNFALSFYAAQTLVLEVELCWSCQDASFFVGEKDRFSCDFAVDTQAAILLRRRLKALFPTFRTEEEIAPDFFHNWR